MPVSPSRPLQMRWTALLTVLALPASLLGCNQTKALLPLMDVCSGQGISEAADYTPNASEAVAITSFVFGENLQELDNRYASVQFRQATKVKEAQLVLCVNLEPRKSIEDCSYVGVEGSIPRTERSATVQLVVAKTGQVLKEEKLTAQIEACPGSISYRPPDSSWNIHQETVQFNPFNADFLLRDQVGDWSIQAVTTASP
ncbi:MAG: hypothetical protein VKJ09_09610 [Leptolyngbya sp.]|nr:hypothetical protein [Leptolyngbya sp.]